MIEGSLPKLTGEPIELLPAADGYERVKALIALGLIDDASRELSVAKKKNGRSKGDASLARLYLEIGNYTGAMGFFTPAQLKKTGQEGKTAWSVLYPKAFGDMVTSHASSAGVSPSLAFAVMRSESSFNPGATSPVGARGLMQLMPDTAAKILKDKEFAAERLYDPELNIRLGTKHLKDLLDQYKGNLVAVIASYNAGGHNVNRWLKSYSGLATDEFIRSYGNDQLNSRVNVPLPAGRWKIGWKVDLPNRASSSRLLRQGERILVSGPVEWYLFDNAGRHVQTGSVAPGGITLDAARGLAYMMNKLGYLVARKLTDGALSFLMGVDFGNNFMHPFIVPRKHFLITTGIELQRNPHDLPPDLSSLQLMDLGETPEVSRDQILKSFHTVKNPGLRCSGVETEPGFELELRVPGEWQV